MSKKSFITVTTYAAAMTLGAAAHAQNQAKPGVEVYGLVDVMVRSANHTNNSTTVNDGAYTGSRLGVRGNRKMQNGFDAFFTVEMGYDPTTGTSGQTSSSSKLGEGSTSSGRLFGRQALVGLTTPAGTISVGRQYTLAHELSGRFQPQSNSNADSLKVMSDYHRARQDNMIKYAKSFDALNVYGTFTANEGNGSAKGVGASYKGTNFEILGYASDMDTNAAGADTQKIKGLGFNYKLSNDLTVYFGGMSQRFAVNTKTNDVTTVGANYKISPVLTFTAGYTDDKQSGSNAGHRKITFAGVSYLLDKDTDVYVIADNNKINGNYAAPSFFSTGAKDQMGFNVGIRYKF
jgi:predicted porin